MQLRKLKYLKIKEGLKNPSSLLRSVSLDTTVEEYKSLLVKEYMYDLYNENDEGQSLYNRSINNRIDLKGKYLFQNINNYLSSYKLSSNYVQLVKAFTQVKERFDILASSEMYDPSVCKIGLLKKEGKFHIGIHFPVLFLAQIDSTVHKKIEIRDLYLYLNGNNLNGFRTTLDSKNMGFIHPHMGHQFGNFCIGSSPLRMSMDVLNAFDNYTSDDADIFWVNLYRTITQKTSEGAHYFDLDQLNKGREVTNKEWDKIVKSSNLYNSIAFHLDYDISEYDVTCKVDYDAVILNNYELFSSEGTETPDAEGCIDTVFFNNRKISKVKYVTIYKGSRKIFSNARYRLSVLCNGLGHKGTIKDLYNAYKEKLNKSDNSGATSAAENQVFEFQML